MNGKQLEKIEEILRVVAEHQKFAPIDDDLSENLKQWDESKEEMSLEELDFVAAASGNVPKADYESFLKKMLQK